MSDFAHQLFSTVCGQNVEHTWAGGDVLFPCCQRCSGLYAGAFLALIGLLYLRPRLTGNFLTVQGMFLLVMVPFGFHWLPQGPFVRTVTGALFGFGLVVFLALPMWSRLPERDRERIGSSPAAHPQAWAYYAIACFTGLAVYFFGVFGGKLAFYAMEGAALFGAGILGLLVLTNIALLVMAGRDWLSSTCKWA